MTRRAGGLLALLAACAVLAAIGAAVLDDHGISRDEDAQRTRAENLAAHFADGAELRFRHDHNRFYGLAFDLPLLLAGKALGLDEARHVHLLRNAASHLLFLAGALSCALLARRMTGSTAIALLAFALFVLQPRLYAHSFSNAKDVPALALFAVCLWLAHRAFRRGGAGAFLLCGAGAAVLTNLRIPAGLVLVAAIAGLRVLDLALAPGPAARRRVLASLAAFAAGWAGVLYAVSPYMWADGPAAFIDAIVAFSRHPNPTDVLFQGRVSSSSELPLHYFPVWFAVSTPPVLLALGLAGFALALRRGLAFTFRHSREGGNLHRNWLLAIKIPAFAGMTGKLYEVRPGAALRNTPARFSLLLAACWAGPPAAAALFGAHSYGGWRHLFFIHAPCCVLAAFGAAALVRAARRMAPGAGEGGGKTALRAAAGAGVAAAAVSMTLLHPHQEVYFNGLEDRTTPWRIRERYDFGYERTALRAGLERALAERPDTEVRICGAHSFYAKRSKRILRRADRERILDAGPRGACDTAFSDPRFLRREGPPDSRPRPIVPPAWSLSAYGSSFFDMFDMDEVRAARRRIRDAAALRPPGIAAAFDVRVHDGMVVYARDDCAPEDLEARFFLHVEPVDPADLPEDRRRHGFDNRDFAPRDTAPFRPRPTATRFGESCLVLAPLPDYPVRRVRTGQIVPDGGGWRNLWEGEIVIAGEDRR